MRFHDIVCHEDGWTYSVDGVLNASYPSWFLALNAARQSAEIDCDNGVDASVRFQSMNGTMLPVQQRETVEARERFAPSVTRSASRHDPHPAAATLSP